MPRVSHLPRKIKRISKQEYATRKRILQQYVKFGFKTRTRFNRGEKSAITKAWEKYSNLIGDIDKGIVKYKNVEKRSLRRKLKQDYPTSNKGVFVYDRDPNLKLKITQSGLDFIRLDRTEIFIPFPRRPGLNFAKWASKIIQQYEFDYMALRVGFNHGLQIYDPITAERYLERDVYAITKEYASRRQEQPFTGLYFIDTGGKVAQMKAHNEKIKKKRGKIRRGYGSTKKNKRI